MPDSPRAHTIAHITHEAVEKIGGIGAVLEGLMTSPIYQQRVKRSILVGPTATHMSSDPRHRLGEHGEVLYSSIDQIDKAGLAGKFRPVEWAFNVAIVYGRRTYFDPGSERTGEAEVLLIDVFRANPDRLNVFKLRLWETFGLDSSRYEKAWDFEEYVRLAEPAYYALLALLNEDDLPCMLFSHEFMGMPTALQCILDGGTHFRTVLHGHECATARRIVEDHPGHDVMFYNVLHRAREQGMFIGDVFGDREHMLRHALVSRAHLCDGIIAVGDCTRDELHFLNERLSEARIDLVYNGLPAFAVNMDSKQRSRDMLLDYSKQLLGHEPNVLMTHVTRPVISKGLWRDLKVCHDLDRHFQRQDLTGVLYILTSGGGVRRPQDVVAMESRYGWPREHREGYPDLVGPEVGLWRDIQGFNANHRRIQVVLVNQFGWSRPAIGQRLPEDMHIADLRIATDIEFGMATYEPFGISPLEPLGSGAVCVISSVCGCVGFVRHASNGQMHKNVIVADYVSAADGRPIEQLLGMDQAERDAIEQQVSGDLAEQIMAALPGGDADRAALIDTGQQLVAAMSWDRVAEEELLPMLDRLAAAGPTVLNPVDQVR